MRRLSSHLILTPNGLESGKVVTLSDDGTIVDISTPAHLDREAGVEFFSGVIVPGFLNSHCHLELSHLHGAIAPGGGFAAFVRGMRAARENYELRTDDKPGDIEFSRMAGARRRETKIITNYGQADAPRSSPADFWDAKMWNEGVSAVADVCNGSSTFDLKTRSRIKYHNFCELFGLHADSSHAAALRDKAVGMGLAVSVTPHSTYSLNRDTFSSTVSAGIGGPGCSVAGCIGEPLAPRSIPPLWPVKSVRAVLTLRSLFADTATSAVEAVASGAEGDANRRSLGADVAATATKEGTFERGDINFSHRHREDGVVDQRSSSRCLGIANELAMPSLRCSVRDDRMPPRQGDIAIAPPLSIHFMESEDETELFKKRGPMWDWYMEQGMRPDFLDYGSPAERLVAQVPKERPVMLVHNCVVTQRDIDIVMGHFTAPVTWVVCPGSNRYISGLEPPVDLLRKNHLKIAVGTDSLASNTTLSMVRELALIKNVPLAELLGWAAADTIEPGHAPGLVLLTGLDLQNLTLTGATESRRIT